MRRRDALQIGVISALGLGLPEFLQAANRRNVSTKPRAKSCILLWLDGGPSHLDMWDLKPEAPAEVRGPFRPIPTVTPGIQISECLPETAKVTDQISILRSVTSPLGEHGLANRYLLTGYKPSESLEYPCFGSVMSSVLPESTALPKAIAIPQAGVASSGFLGSEHALFSTGGDPSKPDFQVRNLGLFPEVDETRLLKRRDYLREFDQAQKTFDATNSRQDESFERAYRLITSPDAKGAFELADEPEHIRARYGPRMFGQSCLLARRLVERGVPFVSVHHTGWDTHDRLNLQLKEGYAGAKEGVGLLPVFDLGFSALIGDLKSRGMLDETLVIAMGEFGRTPKINTQGGRDHWPRVFSVVFAGGGVPGGQIIGASDRIGESPVKKPVMPNDLACTIYTLLGIDPSRELKTSDGRPIAINQGGRVISELLG
ncbi:DUF1501 domain-containing protein [Pirellulaceae bacterium SH449]